MTIDNLKAKISNVLTSDGCSAEFFFLLDNGGEMNIKSVDINDKDHSELEGIFIRSVSDTILLNDDLSLIPLSSADDRKDAVYEYDLDDIPQELSYLMHIIENENFHTFDLKSDDLSHLEGILILIGNQDVQLALYKHQYPITLLNKDSGFSLMKPNGENRFKKLDADILKISSKFEFIRIDDHYYILDIKTLERFFGFHDAVKNVAEKGVANIKNTELVEDCTVLEARLQDISFSRKLVKSASNSPVLGKIPNAQIINFTRNHPALRGKFQYSANGSQISLNTKKSQNLFLKLLNDDFLQSELTRLFYDSIAKDSVGEIEVEIA
ncbi:anti-phage protein KwaB [Cellvibrio sp. ARAG 10.3]|uniref:anti-phage protein KwaB n=1 Tax=Cellvibrio sp. ARAG 10.3 TaxID=3451358 RepID=UPI003F47B804